MGKGVVMKYNYVEMLVEPKGGAVGINGTPIHQKNVVRLLLEQQAELEKCYAEIADKEAVIADIGMKKEPQKRYCPMCNAEQEYYPNPYYMHICSVCNESYSEKK